MLECIKAGLHKSPLALLGASPRPGPLPLPAPFCVRGPSPPLTCHYTLQVSFDLSNSMHVDPWDGRRSYAVWLSRLGYAGLGQSSHWWLLFPRHGLAVALVHGTYVSWDGRVQHHCTAVPQVAPGDRLLSLFCTLPADCMKANERALMGVEALREGGPVFARLAVGMLVMFRQVDPKRASAPQPESKAAKRAWGKAHFRFVRSSVVDLTDTHATLRVESSGVCKVLAKCEVNNIVVVGWD